MPGPIEINKQGRPDPNQGAEVMKQLARLPGAAITPGIADGEMDTE